MTCVIGAARVSSEKLAHSFRFPIKETSTAVLDPLACTREPCSQLSTKHAFFQQGNRFHYPHGRVATMYDKGSPNSTAAWARAATARFCPKRDTDFAGACIWYSVPSIPSFDVCTYCYNAHIAPTPFAKEFVPQNDRPEVEKFCDFHFPYTTGMWYHTVRAGSTEPFLQHVKTVASLSKCRGMEGSTPRPGL